MHGPIQALLEHVEELLASTPHNTTILTEPNIRLLLDPSGPSDNTASHDSFPSTHNVKYIIHLLATAPDQHILALQLGQTSAQKTLREVLTPVELSRVHQATYARLQILQRQSVHVSAAPAKQTPPNAAREISRRCIKRTMRRFVRTAGIAAVLDETAVESLICLLWEDLVGVEDGLNSLDLLGPDDGAKQASEVLVVKLEAILAKCLGIGVEGAGLKEGQFRWVLEMRGMCREVLCVVG